MREIVSLHIGQCGIHIGAKFWDIIKSESEGNPVFYDDTNYPRALFIDLDTRATDNLRALNRDFSESSFIASDVSSSNNWGVGKYTHSSDVGQTVMEQIRKIDEKEGRPDQFLTTLGIGGGTGSGLSSYILTKIDEEYRYNLGVCFAVFPNSKYSYNVLEPYNFTLGINSINYSTYIICPIDNESLVNMSLRYYGNCRPTYADLNKIIAQTMSDLTAGNRFPGQLNCGIRKIATNLVPYHSKHILVPSVAYLNHSSIHEVHKKLFSRHSMLCCNEIGSVLAAGVLYRGKYFTGEIEFDLARLASKQKEYSYPSFNLSFTVGMSDAPPSSGELSASLFSNTDAIARTLQSQLDQFDKMFNRKAYLHWFYQEGVDEMEMVEARSNLEDLVVEYQNMEVAGNHG